MSHALRMQTPWSPALLVCLVALSSTDLRAQDWTRFRGPNGSGVVSESQFPATWTADDYQWDVALPGIGHSSVVTWGNQAFVMSADPAKATRYVMALDLETGKTNWLNEYPSSSHLLHPNNSFASGTPAVDRRGLYVAWSTPEATTLLALTHDGQQRWSRDLGRWVSQHGFGTSPIVHGDRVILFNSQQKDQLDPGQAPGQSRMMAFDAETGETLWESETNTTRVCYGVPCIRTRSDGREELVACNTGNGIFGMDLETGKLNWQIDVFNQRCVASPILAGDLVLGSCGSGGGGNVLVAVRPEPEPTEVFRVTSNANYVPTPVAHKGLAYLLSDKVGVVSCVDLKTGDVVWKERVGKGFSGSPVLAGDKLYLIDDSGILHVLAASRTFKQLGRIDLGEPSRSTPAISQGLMFLRTESRLRALPALSSR